MAASRLDIEDLVVTSFTTSAESASAAAGTIEPYPSNYDPRCMSLEPRCQSPFCVQTYDDRCIIGVPA